VDDWLTTNRRMWDERVPLHADSAFYDMEAFKAGRPSLLPHEVEELGALDGCRVLHLQCHLGLDTLDLARLHPTVHVTGVDFSAAAVDAAATLARELRLAERSRFVVGDVYHAVDLLGAERFDVVYTGKGALLWLPDMDGWAAEVAGLLAPGGFLYLTELHPVADALGNDEPRPVRDYFATEPEIVEDPGSYAVPGAATEHNTRYEWLHPLSRVITALLGAGLQLELLHEWDFAMDGLHSWLVQGSDGRYRWPPGSGTLPLMYSLKAVRPS
jgi:SAM-dependent methyltransferase